MIPINLLKEDTLAFLDAKGFKAIILYTPNNMMNKMKFKLQEKKDPTRYQSCPFEDLKIKDFSKNKYLKSFIKLSTPCFHTMSDIRTFKYSIMNKLTILFFVTFINTTYIYLHLLD